MVDAVAMFPNSDHVEPGEPAAPVEESKLAEKLYPVIDKPDTQAVLRRENAATPPDILQAREADAVRKMFSVQADGDEGKAIRETLDSLDPDAPNDSRRAITEEWLEIARDFDLPNPEIRELATLSKTDAFPDEATVSRWRTESDRNLKSAFGQDTERAGADARKLVQRDPRLMAMLDRTGLGDHPKVVLAITHAARRLRAQGKLR